jgi:hypothetical protein
MGGVVSGGVVVVGGAVDRRGGVISGVISGVVWRSGAQAGLIKQRIGGVIRVNLLVLPWIVLAEGTIAGGGGGEEAMEAEAMEGGELRDGADERVNQGIKGRVKEQIRIRVHG